MCDNKYELEDKYMKECEHKHWMRICGDCGEVIEDDEHVYLVKATSDSTTVYEDRCEVG